MSLPTPDDLFKGHLAFTSAEPTEAQKRLYDAFPTYRGPEGSEVSDYDTGLFEATIVMALVQTVSTSDKVYFFIPGSFEKRAVIALQEFAAKMFVGIKERKAVNQAKAMGKAFKAIHLGCKVLQVKTPPERWVVFGFSTKDTVPEWLRKALLPPVQP